MIRPHPTISHAWQLSADGSFQGPHIGIIGALHGNEVAGLRAIERVLKEGDEFSRRLGKGTLVLIHGNPRATEQGRRFSVGGSDINRLFAYQFEEELAPEAWAYEHHRAVELKPFITGLDAMLDLHSASRPTLPFAICSGTSESVHLASKTGCHVTWGWDGPGMLMEHVSIGSLVAKQRPAISVECGQHQGEGTAEVAYAILTRFLGALQFADFPFDPTDQQGFAVFGRVVKPTHEFALSQDFSSFDELDAGSELGSGGGVVIRVEERAALLLPTPTAQRGDDIVYLARRAALP